jgi:hypothetical protein
MLSACEKSSKKTLTPSTSISIPTVDFVLPESSFSLNLLAGSDDLLLNTQQRVNDRIEKLNEDLTKWQGEFTEVGTYTGKGPDNDKSGALTALDDGTDGQFVAYRNGADADCTSFNKSNPTWCKARTISGGTGTAATPATVWTALQGLNLSVTSATTLGDPTETESCPTTN